MKGLIVEGLPAELIRAAYTAAPGNEIESGKFASPESSAALVANTFGYFLQRPDMLPALPNIGITQWKAESIALEGIVRLPWSGGRHPCLDVLIRTPTHLIGVESKRYEPFRAKAPPILADAYWRPLWGDRMAGYEHVRDSLRSGKLKFSYLDAAQLIKHALGLRTAIHNAHKGKQAILFYLHAEPQRWPNGSSVGESGRQLHAREIYQFSSLVGLDEVRFVSCSYQALLANWSRDVDPRVRAHAEALRMSFDI